MARKIENEELLEEASSVSASEHIPAAPVPPAVAVPQEPGGDVPSSKGKRKVVVINVPKRKKLLWTPTRILRIVMICALVVVLLLLTYPFMEVRFYITKSMEVTPRAEEAYDVLATQEEIDQAEQELRQAFDALVLAPKEEESDSSQQDSGVSQQDSAVQDSQTSAEASSAAPKSSGSGYLQEINTLDYNWMYTIQEGIHEEKLIELVDEVKKINRNAYTAESLERLNTAILKAQKVLCASVFVSQNALQMMLGGTVGEAFGGNISLSNTFLRAILTFALGILPLVAILACLIDRKRMIKNVIVMICSVLVLLDIFLTIYPYVGIGAVLTIIMYVIIMLLNIGAFYAGQQEKFIVNHPELETEYTIKHPQFVKALINWKSIHGTAVPPRAEKERAAAVNAQKRRSKKKKGR